MDKSQIRKDGFADHEFRKSTFSSNNGACVEVAIRANAIGVRDSKDKSGPVLAFTVDEWDAFLGGIRGGEFNL